MVLHTHTHTSVGCLSFVVVGGGEKNKESTNLPAPQSDLKGCTNSFLPNFSLPAARFTTFKSGGQKHGGPCLS